MQVKKSRSTSGKEKIEVKFGSITEFIKYINETPTNKVFGGRELASQETDDMAKNFTETENYEQAVGLLTNGWSDIAKQLNKQLQLNTLHIKNNTKSKTVYDVVGHQAIVPLYLQGVPQNMAHTKMVSIPNKVITIDKCIGVLAHVTTKQIIDGSIKAMQIVKQLEAQGYRINLNLLAVAEVSNQILGCKISVKKANEKLNISKLAFPMVHPSMHRRLVFRFREVFPETSNMFVGGYGRTVRFNDIKKYWVEENEIVLPLDIEGEVENIKTIEDVKANF